MKKYKRASGYYWIKYSGSWRVAEYNSKYKDWHFAGIEQTFEDKEFDEIAEERLMHPSPPILPKNKCDLRDWG